MLSVLRSVPQMRTLTKIHVLSCHHHTCHVNPLLITSSRTIMTHLETYLKGGVDIPHVVETQNLLVSLHQTYGTGHWALDIIASTVLLKTLFSLPLMSWRMNIFFSYGKMMERITKESIEKLFVKARRFEVDLMDPKTGIRYRRIINKLKNEEILQTNNNPLRGFVVMGIEAGIYITYFLAVKNLCLGLPNELALVAQNQLQNCSFLWLSDLTVPDPYHLFPILAFKSCILTTEYMVQSRKQNGIPDRLLFRLIKYGGRTFSVVFFYIVLHAPSAIAIYWTASTSIGLLQIVLLANPEFKKLLRIPVDGGFKKQVDLKLWKEDIKHHLKYWFKKK